MSQIYAGKNNSIKKLKQLVRLRLEDLTNPKGNVS